MTARKIMIIRHAEKPSDDGAVHGVSLEGRASGHELSVRGWQRAGALAPFFAPATAPDPACLIQTPRALFASAAGPNGGSLRPKHTLRPLAERLDLAIDDRFADGAEGRLAAALMAVEGPVLIAWHRKHIPSLVRHILGEDGVCPVAWAADRFDLVWVLDLASDETWRFQQAPQLLLAGDSPHPL